LFDHRHGRLVGTADASDTKHMALRVLASFVVVAGLLVPATAPAKKPVTGKLPPGLAKKLVDRVAGSDAVTRTTKAVNDVAKGKPAKAPKAKPEQANGPKQTPPAQATPSQKPPTTSTPATTTPATSSPPAATDAVAPASTAAPRAGDSAEQARGRTSRRERAAGRPRQNTPAAATAAGTNPTPAVPAAPGAPDRSPTDGVRDRDRDRPASTDQGSPVVRTVRDIVETVPGWMKLALAALGALSLLLAGGYAVSALRARRLARQRSELLGEVGLLQKALLPAVPHDLDGLHASVAYRPADGPAAGGDFYDVLPLPGERVGFVLGDVSGHGRGALERTAFMRYTLRAYLEAGLEPRVALQVAGRVIGDGLGGDFATVLLAVHDARDGSLTYASAGHPAPIVVGGTPFEPVIAGSSPPIGIGEPTGLRQTTVPLVPRAVACIYTDGLVEARTAGGLLGRDRLEELIRELDVGHDQTAATELLEQVATEAVAAPDDMATCILTPTAGVTAGGFRTEQLELSATELDGPLLDRFLVECGVAEESRVDAVHDAAETARQYGGAVVSVVFGSRRAVSVRPSNVESIETAARRTHPRPATLARSSA
jgi:hypothetical protein